MKQKKTNSKPLTLDVLAKYNKEILFPEMKEVFATKTEFKEFKNETLTNQDAMLKKLDTLLTEKTVREYQEDKEKKLWVVVIKALKEHRILSPNDLQAIAQLEMF